MKKHFLIILIGLIISFSFNLYSEETLTQDSEEITAKTVFSDLRRFEVVTFGSLPFVTMDFSLGYSFYHVTIKKDSADLGISSISPFLSLTAVDLTDDSLTSSEKFKKFWKSPTGTVILGSMALAVSVGISDFAIRAIKRSGIKNRNKKNKDNSIIITDLENDPDATKLSLPADKTQKESF